MHKSSFNLRRWQQPLSPTTYYRRPCSRLSRALVLALVCVVLLWCRYADRLECAVPGDCSIGATKLRTTGDGILSSQLPRKFKIKPLTPLVREATHKLLEEHKLPAIEDDSSGDTKNAQLITAPEDLSRFPSFSKQAEVKDKAETLPDIIYVPFEESTADVTLSGWEDRWFSDAEFIHENGALQEPKIDIVYTWVNGSDEAFQATMYPYEENSTLSDEEGTWITSHRVNRYRDWDELRYSIRSVEKYASAFRNKIQILVNSVADPGEILTQHATVDHPAFIHRKQRPSWLKSDADVEVFSQEEFFGDIEKACLPSFNSLTTENQAFNTKSDTDRFFALSDDMILGKQHAASDIYSPLFGPTMGFKPKEYNTHKTPTDNDAGRFGEKPFLVYTSWMLNRRFGSRRRKGQVHFGHSMSRSVAKEAMDSFPRPSLQSACQKFRGESGFQLYSWYLAFHYTIERHREALLWSYIMLRSDADQDGNLRLEERQTILEDLQAGISHEGKSSSRKRMFYRIPESLEKAGLEAPKVNLDVLWTSLDGPLAIKGLDCYEFNITKCLAPDFASTGPQNSGSDFGTATVFDRLARQHPECGDCLIKLLLNRVKQGLAPLLPHPNTQSHQREMVIKALWKYQYTVVEPDAMFVMVTDAEQIEHKLRERLIKREETVGQLCLNDDVETDEDGPVADVRKVMQEVLQQMFPEPSIFENDL